MYAVLNWTFSYGLLELLAVLMKQFYILIFGICAFFYLKLKSQAVVAHAFDTSTQEAETTGTSL